MDPNRKPSPSDIAAGHVEQIYILANVLKTADHRMTLLPRYGVRPALDALFDRPVFPADLDKLAASLKAIADEWQSEIDAEAE